MSGSAESPGERRETVAGVETFWREAPAHGGARPALYVHGVPTNSDDFTPFLERSGGIALDLPGFGRSGKPAHFDYSVAGYSRFLAAFTEHAGAEKVSLVVHDWGAAALGWAQANPGRIERLVIMNAVPLLEGYSWHRIARAWRTPLVGELAMGVTTRWGLRLLSREATASDGPAPDELIDRVWEHFDHGTQRAILKLYRSAPPHALAQAGAGLGELRCPALVIWGREDPYIPSRFAEAYAQALGGEAELRLVDRAGHWPWIDRPEVIAAVTRFVAAGHE